LRSSSVSDKVKSSMMSICVCRRAIHQRTTSATYLTDLRPTLTMQQLAPTNRTTCSTSAAFVTSTLTHKLVFLRSMVSRRRRAAGFSKLWMRASYDSLVKDCEDMMGSNLKL
jgi:hypothetical protein